MRFGKPPNMNTHTNTPAAAFAARRSRPEPRNSANVFLDEKPRVYSAEDEAARPELEPANDAYGRLVGFLCVETEGGAGDARPTHAALSAANMDAELTPLGIYRTAEGRLLVHFRLASLAGAKVEADAGFYMELNPAAPIGRVWDALFRPAFPKAEGEG